PGIDNIRILAFLFSCPLHLPAQPLVAWSAATVASQVWCCNVDGVQIQDRGAGDNRNAVTRTFGSPLSIFLSHQSLCPHLRHDQSLSASTRRSRLLRSDGMRNVEWSERIWFGDHADDR
ncbi:hypothetical protein, partial [Novipirellula sp.]|uniref:hypothetical protein n=1 Tax=Novipirellula sp. TaxID=2795430 RepID=UPI003567BD35